MSITLGKYIQFEFYYVDYIARKAIITKAKIILNNKCTRWNESNLIPQK